MNCHSQQFAMFAALLSLSGLVYSAPSRYRVTGIGVNDGTTTTFVQGLNNLGELSLTVSNSATGLTRSFLWRDGKVTGLGTVGGLGNPTNVAAFGINDLSVIVGTASSVQGNTFRAVAFLWRRGLIENIGFPPGDSYSITATRVNNRNQIIGTASSSNITEEAFLWDQGHYTVLPGRPGAAIAGPGGVNAYGINDLGDVVGSSGDGCNCAEGVRAVIWRHGRLAVVLGVLPNAAGSVANDINDVGHVIGTSNSFNHPIPFLWKDGTMSALPLPVGQEQQSASPNAINDRDQIVGGVGSSAVLWQNGTVLDLTSSIRSSDPLKPYITLLGGNAINNRGQVVAVGTDSRAPGVMSSYLLTPEN